MRFVSIRFSGNSNIERTQADQMDSSREDEDKVKNGI